MTEPRAASELDTREWRVTVDTAVHVDAVVNDADGFFQRIATVHGTTRAEAVRTAEQMVREHAMLSAPYADDQHRGGHWLAVLPQRPRWAET